MKGDNLGTSWSVDNYSCREHKVYIAFEVDSPGIGSAKGDQIARMLRDWHGAEREVGSEGYMDLAME